MKNNRLPVRGIGNDIVEVERVRESYERHGYRFLTRLFTVREQDYCLKFQDPVPHLAARFSAKESIAKALGTGLGEQLFWLDMEILNDVAGKPSVFFSEEAKKRFDDPLILLSISHCRLYVSTSAIWINTEPSPS